MMSGLALVFGVVMRPHLGVAGAALVGVTGLAWIVTSIRPSEARSAAQRVARALGGGERAKGNER
jgi:hypothetical protein